ncbi:MAG: phosphoglycerol geranylgeranyltransferase [Thermoplasmata archaeon]|nr:phosphoglycerol geranylgeranyltransferase [Thermoplasmata archaeon]
MRHLRHGPLHITLIDPDKQGPEEAGAMAKSAADAGSHAIMVGGSTPERRRVLDEAVKLIKKESGLPVILFPGAATQVSAHADAIWFMSLLNSRSREFLVGEQVRGAPIIEKLGIEPIPMGYIVVEPGGTVGRVGQADLLRRDDLDGAIAYALAAQSFGMRFVYLEAGSGADTPVPPEMVRAVKRAVRVPVIVGGGLRTAQAAHDAIEAGADIIVTGTLVEGVTDVRKTLGDYLFSLSEKLRREVRRHLIPDDEGAPRKEVEPQ